MKTVSQQYKEQMRKPIRNPSYVRVRFLQVAAGAAADARYQDDGHTYFSEWESVGNDAYTPAFTYATLERDRFRLDGSQVLPPDEGQAFTPTGFVSDNIGGAATVEIDLAARYKLFGLTFLFDPICDDYPTDMTITYLLGGTAVDAFRVTPDAARHSIERRVDAVDRIRVEIHAMNKPCRRPRIQTILYGVEKLFTVKELKSVETVSDVDPITRRLPAETMTFVVYDYEKEYDPDNPGGSWEYIDANAPIYLSFGYALDGGRVEWLDWTKYELNGKPTVAGAQAKFTATGMTGCMNDTYYKSAFGERSLYDMALHVLQDADLPAASDMSEPWVLDDSLRTILTDGILPIGTHKECLQLIAHAGMCRLFTDDDNKIHLERFAAPAEASGFVLDLASDMDFPAVSKIDPLYAINVMQYSHTFGDVSELHKSTFPVSGETDFHVEFSAASEVAVDVAGGTASDIQVYAQAVDMKITADGEVTVTVTGKTATESKNGTPVVVGADARGETETVENPLVTRPAHRDALAQHIAGYLKLRNTYTVNYRGNPEVETGDLISLESPFTAEIPALVLKHTIRFGGALSGGMIAKAVIAGG